MKTVLILPALAMLVSVPTLAAPLYTTHNPHHLHQGRQSTNSNASAKDPMGAYVNGREIGRDPDPNVREELKKDYSLFHWDQD